MERTDMAEFISFDPGVEVLGRVVLSTFAAPDEQTEPVLGEYGLREADPESWYPLQALLDVLQELAERGHFNMISIGMTIPDVAKFPTKIDTVEDALVMLGEAYQMNHRGGAIGEYVFKKTGEQTGEMLCRNPYPSDFDYGLIYRLIQKYRPDDSAKFRVARDDSLSNRTNGGDACIYHISW
jgi:hypothetical protein